MSEPHPMAHCFNAPDEPTEWRLDDYIACAAFIEDGGDLPERWQSRIAKIINDPSLPIIRDLSRERFGHELPIHKLLARLIDWLARLRRQREYEVRRLPLRVVVAELGGKLPDEPDQAPPDQTKKRPCHDRDHLWLAWSDDGMGDAAIRDRWNAECKQHGGEPISDKDTKENGREIVKTGIKKARAERDGKPKKRRGAAKKTRR